MKAEIISIEGQKKGSFELPKIFESEIRTDLIRRAYDAEQSLKKPKYGSFYMAGKMNSATKQMKHARDGYKAHYGQGISRVPRKAMSRRGTRFFWVGAFAPGMRGGRPAHPPKPYTNPIKLINQKEKKKAFYSALSASKIIVIENKFEDIKKTKDIIKAVRAIVPKEIKNALIVTSKINMNISDAEIVPLKQISVSALAPNAMPRKLVLWTENAIREIK